MTFEEFDAQQPFGLHHAHLVALTTRWDRGTLELELRIAIDERHLFFESEVLVVHGLQSFSVTQAVGGRDREVKAAKVFPGWSSSPQASLPLCLFHFRPFRRGALHRPVGAKRAGFVKRASPPHVGRVGRADKVWTARRLALLTRAQPAPQ